MVTITQLRRNKGLRKNLGFRERKILFSKGARVFVATNYPPRGAFLEVATKSGNSSFVFAIRTNRNAKIYTIVA